MRFFYTIESYHISIF